jgi:DNA-binding MarR family transcriptional regulator
LSGPDRNTATLFALFNEIGIIAQLSGSLFERRLPEGFLVSHFAVLNHLVRLGDGRTPLEIARAFQVPKTTMTHTLQGLEKAGLIAFAPNPADGRSKCVMLTDAGRTFRDTAIAALGPDLARLATAIPPARIAEILPLLAEVRVWLDRERGGAE